MLANAGWVQGRAQLELAANCWCRAIEQQPGPLDSIFKMTKLTLSKNSRERRDPNLVIDTKTLAYAELEPRHRRMIVG
jgi:hypothetical protein